VQVRKKIPAYPGIDFLSAGCYVVGVGSIHPDTGREYTWAGERVLRDAQDAPEAIIRLIERVVGVDAGEITRGQAFSGSTNGTSPAGPGDFDRYVSYLKSAQPAVEGENGDAQTFKVCCKGKDLGLSQEETLKAVAAYYNQRCVPPWAPNELAAKVRNAYSYSLLPAGNALAQNEFSEVPNEEKSSEYSRVDIDGKGTMSKTLNNAVNSMMRDPKLSDLLAWDEFYGMVRLLKPAPWTRGELPADGVEWSDSDSIQLRLYIGRTRKFDMPIQLVDQAVVAVSELRTIHPVQDYLNGLVWDGVPRLHDWLHKYAGARPDKYTSEVAEKTILQAVKRVFEPGCKADYVLILEGTQGVGKSTLIEILGGKWYADIVIDPHARDTADAMRGKWFVEFSEMEVTRRADAQALKAFITRKVDRFRLAYARRAKDLPRQCVFVGTINPDATNEYLSDSTGNRRFWPVEVRQVDFDGLSAVRDQLFAEAVGIVKSGKATHILDAEVIEVARLEQKERQATDPWTDVIREWLPESGTEIVTTKDVWIHALRGRESELTMHHQKRIAASLKTLGWNNGVKRVGGKMMRGYLMPGSELMS
jgi:predicted P-loop ATPase